VHSEPVRQQADPPAGDGGARLNSHTARTALAPAAASAGRKVRKPAPAKVTTKRTIDGLAARSTSAAEGRLANRRRLGEG
jgi:hypothetical protein